MKTWLSWWHERRHIIFRAFKSGNALRSNLFEVIHSGWKNRCEVGLSLLESTEFDVRDYFILKAQLGQLGEKEQGFGSGPSFGQLKEGRNVRNVECVKRKGNELIDFGVRVDSDKKKWSQSKDKLLNNRMDAAAKGSSTMKIRKITPVLELKRKYSVLSSTNSKTTYLVTTTEISSCRCPGFEKNGRYVFCKHIIFLLVHVLANTHINKHLENRHLPRQVLTDLFATTISESYKQRQKLNRKDLLDESPYYQNEQTWELQLKSRRRAKCSSTKCDKDLKSGFLCLCVSGALSVPYQVEKAVLRKFYLCPLKTCNHARLLWTNIKLPAHLTRDEFVSEVAFNRVRQRLET